MTRVLIVAADPAEAQRAESALHLHGDVEVDVALEGPAAADLLREGGHDVLVVDGDLQPKGGFSWLYELREAALLKDGLRPPAVVMTSRPEDRFLADWAGAEATVRKPVDPFEIADVVQRLHTAASTAGGTPTAG